MVQWDQLYGIVVYIFQERHGLVVTKQIRDTKENILSTC